MDLGPQPVDTPVTSGREKGERPLPSVGDAFLVLLLCAVLYLAGGVAAQIFLGEPGLLAAQIVFMALPAVLYIYLRGYDLRRTFALATPDSRQVAGGLILLVGATQVAWFLAWLQSLVAPVPVEYLEMLAEMVTADSLPRFIWLLLLVALAPAVAEEVLFRGVLLSGLRSRVSPMAAVVLSGLIFGLFHVAPETGFRILPTAWLGVVLAWVVVVTGSLPLAVFLHFMNNGAILTLMALPATRELVMGSPDAAPPLILLPLALGAAVLGVVLLHFSPPGKGGPNPDVVP